MHWHCRLKFLRLAEESTGYESNEAFHGGFLDEMFVGVCREIEIELSENQKNRLLSKVSEMVEIKGGTFVMGSPEDEEESI